MTKLANKLIEFFLKRWSVHFVATDTGDFQIILSTPRRMVIRRISEIQYWNGIDHDTALLAELISMEQLLLEPTESDNANHGS